MANIIQAAQWIKHGKHVRRACDPEVIYAPFYEGNDYNPLTHIMAFDSDSKKEMVLPMWAEDWIADDWEVV